MDLFGEDSEDEVETNKNTSETNQNKAHAKSCDRAAVEKLKVEKETLASDDGEGFDLFAEFSSDDDDGWPKKKRKEVSQRDGAETNEVKEDTREEAVAEKRRHQPAKSATAREVYLKITTRSGSLIGRNRGEKPFFSKPAFVGDYLPFSLGHEMTTKEKLIDENKECGSKMIDKLEMFVHDAESGEKDGGSFKGDHDLHDFVARRREQQDIQWVNFVGERRKALWFQPKSLQATCLQVIRNDSSLFTLLQQRSEPFDLVPDHLFEACMQLQREYSIPATINRYLEDYQREGAKFLFDIFSGLSSPEDTERRGGVLADEMGLGKTVQVIAFFAALLRKSGTLDDQEILHSRRIDTNLRKSFVQEGPILVVTPESIQENWGEELDRWGYFDVVMLGKVSSSTVKEGVATQLAGIKAGNGEVIICGYHRMVSLVEDTMFKSIKWRVVVFDEVHRLKTTTTQVSRAARHIRCSCKLGLTGTPMSNNLMELWGIMLVLSPMTFGPRETFKLQFANPISKGRKLNASRADVLAQQEASALLSRTLSRLVKRRRKTVIDHKLHGKQDLMVLCPLTTKQEAVYLRALQSADYLKMLQSISHQNVVEREVPVEDRSLWIPANRIEETDSPEKSIDTALPLWRLNHRDWEDEQNKDGSPEAEVDLGLHRAVTRFRLEKHDSSESETDDNENEEGGVVFRRYASCLGCPRCMMLPLLLHLTNIANHLELVRVPPLGTGRQLVKSTKLVKRKFRKRLRVAKLLLGVGSEREGDSTNSFPGLKDKKSENAPFLRSNKFQNLIDDSQCGKLQVLRKLLQRWRAIQGVKVLIFSNSLVLLDILESYLNSQAIPLFRLDGSTPQSDRQSLCKEFNKDPNQFCLLISTKAGGEGLNITGASKVIIFDPNWNPSADLQAQDRAFRIGQTRFVQVYRFISQGTIEEAKFLRQVDKQQLSSTILDESTEKRLFTENEFRGLAELLRYSRKSFTLEIRERYARKRQRYMRKGTDLSPLPAFQPSSTDNRSGDNFAVIEMNLPDAITQPRLKELNAEQEDIGRSVNWTQLVGNSVEEINYTAEVVNNPDLVVP